MRRASSVPRAPRMSPPPQRQRPDGTCNSAAKIENGLAKQRLATTRLYTMTMCSMVHTWSKLWSGEARTGRNGTTRSPHPAHA